MRLLKCDDMCKELRWQANRLGLLLIFDTSLGSINLRSLSIIPFSHDEVIDMRF